MYDYCKAAEQVLVMTIERPDLYSRTILRQHGFSFVRSLGHEPDEVWMHWQVVCPPLSLLPLSPLSFPTQIGRKGGREE